jgi:[ribosomal protein S18]-alanine N-acetyltransferase
MMMHSPRPSPAAARPETHRVGAEESAQLAAIHADAFPPTERWSGDVFGLQIALPNVIALTDRADGLVLIRTVADEAEILTLAVRSTARRRRLGSALLQEAIVQAAAAAANVMFLEVSIKNTAALALYGGLGFRRVGLRPRYYSDGTDAALMRLDLAGAESKS